MRKAEFYQQTAACLLLIALSGAAATIHVSPTGSATPPFATEATALTTIQAAINAAASGDTIRIHAAIYQENLFITDTTLTLQGDGPVATVIDGRQVSSCVNISNNATVTITGCELRNGHAEKGGGIYLDKSTLTMRHCRIVACRAGRGGGIYSFESSFDFEDGAIYECEAYLFTSDGGKGGAFYILYSPAGSPSRIADSALFANRAVHGALRWWEAHANIERCQIFGNRGQTDVIELRETSTAIVNDCLIYGNQSFDQTIISAYVFSNLSLCHGTIANNTSSSAGSVIFQDVWSTLAMHNNAVQANSPDLVELNPDADLVGNVFSTAPPGFTLTEQSANFAIGDDGKHYLAADPASPSIFIGAGQASALCSVDDANRQPYVSGAGAVPANPPHAGYGYPFGAVGAIDLSTPAFSMTARGRPYLEYRLEIGADPNFVSTNSLPLGPLPSVDFEIPIPLPVERAQFYRMHGSEPKANRASITVTDGAVPLAGITVDVLNATATEWYGSEVTNGSGQAVIEFIPPGNYTVRAGAQSLDYIAYFLGETTEIGSATTFALADGASYSGSLTLTTGNRLSGQVQSAGGAAYEGGSVVVYDTANGDAIIKTATSNASGAFDIGGLPDGSYKIGASGLPQHGIIYHSNVADFANASAIAVSGGGTTAVPPMRLPARQLIAGRVTLPDAGALYQVVVVLYDAADFSEVDFAFCNASGDYELYAEPGTYLLSAGEGSAYVIEFTPQFTHMLGTPALFDFDLQHGGSISGTILDIAGAGIADIFVDFYTQNAGVFTYIDSDISDAGGNYLSPLLAPGTYYVQAYGAPSYNILWYPGTADENQATGVSVNIFQDTPNIDVQLSPAAR